MKINTHNGGINLSDNSFKGRYEHKILISYAEYLLLKSRLSAILEYDSNSNEDGYFIRSIYLDGIYNSSYYQKLMGLDDRKKYRIRCYNYNPDYIKLECKEKKGQFVSKTSAILSQEEAEIILAGDYSFLENREEKVCHELYIESRAKGFYNSIIVDYMREAFVYPISNVRITLDRKLHAGGFENFDLFDKSALTIPIYMNDSVILEIKYDDIIPEYIRALIPSFTGVPVSVSKYCLCKKVDKILH